MPKTWPSGSPTHTALYSGQGVVAAPGNYWNPAGYDIDSSNLLLSDGTTATGISFSFGSPNSNFSKLSTLTANPQDLMGDYMFVKKKSTDLTLTGLLANTEYTLYLYGAGDSVGQGTVFSANGTSKSTSGPLVANADVTEGEDYVVMVVKSDVTGKITVSYANNTAGGNKFGALNGLQIVEPDPDPNASNPVPADGGQVAKYTTELTWTPGAKAVTHKVYFSDDFNEVNDLDPAALIKETMNPSVTVGHPDSAYPDYLVPGLDYFWRVVEVNDADPASPWVGSVWSFLVDPSTKTPVPPEVDVWYNDVTETTASIFAMVTYDGNDSCFGWISLKSEFDNNWRILSHQGEFVTGDMFWHPLKGLLPDTSYQFKASVQNVDSTVSTQAYEFRTLGTRPTLFIYQQPQSQRIAAGRPVELCMGLIAQDVDPALIQYMWFKKAPGQAEEMPIPGADKPCLNIAAVSEADEGEYKCVAIVPGVGVATSNIATLTLERLMAHWKLDANLSDSSGNLWDATMVGSAEDDPNAWTMGAVGQAFYPGNEGPRWAIVHGSEDAFEFWKNGFTVSAWIKIQKGNGWSGIAAKQLRPNNKDWRGWVFNVSPDGKIELGIRGVKNYKAGNNVHNYTWRHVAATYCPVTRKIKIYVNGKQVGSSGLGTKLRGTDQPVVIGTETQDGKFNKFPGLIDEVRIHNYPLDHHQIRNLFGYDRYPELQIK